MNNAYSVEQNRNNLTSVVEAFRLSIETCWSAESAYKIHEIQSYGAYISGGQCAVTCLVLMDVLRNELPDEQVFLVSGQLQSTNGEVVIRDHGWLRVGSGTDAIIVDPTVDQAASISDKIIIGTVDEVEKQGLRYIEKEVEADHGESKHPKRFKRYMILKDAWNHRESGNPDATGVVIGKGNLAGRGVYAARDFKKGDVVIRYNLKRLSKEEWTKLPKSEKMFTHTHWGRIHLYGQPERYVNHSKNPNTHPDLKNQCDVAIQDINKGEMITTDATLDDIET